MKLSSIALIPFFTLFLLLSSCGVLNLTSSTESYDIAKEVVPSYKADQTIKVMNYYDKPVIVFLVPERINADLKQYSETSMENLELGLKHQNVSVGPTGSKSVKLRVPNVKYKRAFWTIRANDTLISSIKSVLTNRSRTTEQKSPQELFAYLKKVNEFFAFTWNASETIYYWSTCQVMDQINVTILRILNKIYF